MDTKAHLTDPDVAEEKATGDVPSTPPEVENGHAAENGSKAQNKPKKAKKTKVEDAKTKDAGTEKEEKEAENKTAKDADTKESEEEEIALEDVDLIDPVERALLSAPEDDKEKKEKKRKKIKDSKIKSALGSKRGVETMFRASYRVQMDLTALADAKANIMITINGLILSILLASIASKMDTNPYLLFPTSITLTTCMLSIIFAVLAAVPRVESSPITLDEVRKRNTNLLFFGNFSKLSREDYHTGMVEMMLDPDRVYHNMISDIYGIGSVLTKKFKLLRTSYIIFMGGVILSVVLFIVTFFLNAGDAVALQPPPSTGGSLPGLP